MLPRDVCFVPINLWGKLKFWIRLSPENDFLKKWVSWKCFTCLHHEIATSSQMYCKVELDYCERMKSVHSLLKWMVKKEAFYTIGCSIASIFLIPPF